MDGAEVEAKIASFDVWHYQFDLKGQRTPIWDSSHVNRHEQRKRYFFDPLVELLGGSLRGKRVLDLGCNAGFWSLLAVERGCEFVAGIDGRQAHVDQANFVFQALDVDESRYSFLADDIFRADLQRLGTFDIVLCLGLLYHTSKHVELFERIIEVNDDLLVIDTALSLAPGSYLQLKKESLEVNRAAVDYELVMYPTRAALVDIAEQFGYSVVVLEPDFTDYEGCEDYLRKSRLAVVAGKTTPVQRIPGPRVEPRPETGLRDVLRLSKRFVRTLPSRARRTIRR